MKKVIFINCCIFLFLIISCKNTIAQNPENWTKDQLVEPSTLAAIINSNKELPVIFSIGPGAVIPNSIDIGMVNSEQNMERFKDRVNKLSKSADIIVYCGCCPFDHCPNVRPAIAFLKSQGFTNYHLLNLPHNLKTDWIDHGYPAVK